MKKILSIAFVVALLCSLSLAMYAGTVYAAGTHHIFQGSVTPIYDGKWTTNDEWSDGETTTIAGTNGVVTGAFVNKYATVGSFGGTDFEVLDQYLVEFFTDKTNDTGDYLQLCYDTTSAGGTSLVSTDIMLQVFGHNGTVKMFIGSGTSWTQASSSVIGPSSSEFGQAVSISKLNGTNPHWTYELAFHKYTNGGGIDCNIMIALYDASNAAAGIQTWPPGAVTTSPGTWGLDDANSNLTTIPEGLSFTPVAALATIALIATFFVMRKRPKT